MSEGLQSTIDQLSTLLTDFSLLIVPSSVQLGLDDQDSIGNTEVYKQEFENPFIAATELYFRTESDAFVAANSSTDYMRKAETRLKEEEDRVELYLHPTTRDRLIRKCEAVLIRGHSQLLWDEFENLLESGKSDDLYRMYTLLYRVSEGLDPLRRSFELYVKKKGMEAVEKVVGTDVEAMVSIRGARSTAASSKPYSHTSTY